MNISEILEKSILENVKIRFPDGIPSIPIRYTQQPRFIIVKENFDGASLSRFKTAKSKIPVTNATETENRFLLEKERHFIFLFRSIKCLSKIYLIIF